MEAAKRASNITAPTQFLAVKNEKYAYRRFGSGPALPLLLLQHFTGTLDNWDYAVTDPLAQRGEVILFESAGLGRSSGKVPETVAGMAEYALAFPGWPRPGYLRRSGDFLWGGMVAQQMALNRPTIFRRMILVGTAPRGGGDIMHLEKPNLSRFLNNPSLKGYSVLQKIFASQKPSRARRRAKPSSIGYWNARRTGSQCPDLKWPKLRCWRSGSGRRSQCASGGPAGDIRQPTLVVNGIHDEMIPILESLLAG